MYIYIYEFEFLSFPSYTCTFAGVIPVMRHLSFRIGNSFASFASRSLHVTEKTNLCSIRSILFCV